MRVSLTVLACKFKLLDNYKEAPIIEVSSVNNFNIAELVTLIIDHLDEGPL